jgi:hypothetical protein
MFTGNYMTYNFPASKHYYKHIKRVTIPKNVKKVKVNVSTLQVYDNQFGWLSGILSSQTVTIK